MSTNTRYLVNNRLAYYRSLNAMNWDVHWAEHISPNLYPKRAKKMGALSFLGKVMPKRGKILEAGCGLGRIVHQMRLHGFDCEGVDNAAETIAAVKTLVPNLPIRVGDVLHLDVPDNYYAGYISLGVVEHRQEGPEPFLREAHRVLAPGGVAVFTVPFYNRIRRMKAKLGCFAKPPKPDEVFYQYAFSAEEMSALLQNHNFKVTAIRYYDPWKGLKDELQPFRYINQQPRLADKFRAWMNNKPKLYPYTAHMLALICRKA